MHPSTYQAEFLNAPQTDQILASQGIKRPRSDSDAALQPTPKRVSTRSASGTGGAGSRRSEMNMVNSQAIKLEILRAELAGLREAAQKKEDEIAVLSGATDNRADVPDHYTNELDHPSAAPSPSADPAVILPPVHMPPSNPHNAVADDAAREKLESTRRHLDAVYAENVRLGGLMDQQKAHAAVEVSRLTELYQGALDEAADRQQDFDTAMGRLAELETVTAEWQAEIGRLETHTAALQSQVDGLTHELNSATETIRHLQAEQMQQS